MTEGIRTRFIAVKELVYSIEDGYLLSQARFAMRDAGIRQCEIRETFSTPLQVQSGTGISRGTGQTLSAWPDQPQD